MILCMENPKESTSKLLELIEEFSNVAGYKINAQTSVAFLYMNNKTEEREITGSSPFTIAPKIICYLGSKLTRDIKDLYSRNYKSLFFFKILFIYSTKIETASKRGNTSRGSGRGRSRLPAEKPDVGLDPRTLGSRPEPKADA